MRKWTLGLAALGLVLGLVTLLDAQPGGKGPGGFPFGRKKGGPDGEPGVAVAGPQMIMRWEYRVEAPATLNGPGGIKTGLNKLGSEGWELVGFDSQNYVFKRPLGAGPRPEIKPPQDPAPRDKDKEEGRLELRAYSLKNAVAQDMVELIATVMRRPGKQFQIGADPRTNQIIINAPAGIHEDVLALVERLDVPAAVTESREPKKGPGPGSFGPFGPGKKFPVKPK